MLERADVCMFRLSLRHDLRRPHLNKQWDISVFYSMGTITTAQKIKSTAQRKAKYQARDTEEKDSKSIYTAICLTAHVATKCLVIHAKIYNLR